MAAADLGAGEHVHPQHVAGTDAVLGIGAVFQRGEVALAGHLGSLQALHGLEAGQCLGQGLGLLGWQHGQAGTGAQQRGCEQ